MHPVSFDRSSYRIGGQPAYLLSGEFHYFRVPKTDWRRRMRLFKEAGGNTLATYIPWLLHEPEEGNFRFSGEDWLDLEGFLETAREMELYVIARPGPYQYSELIYDGLPGWLVKNYPEILARDISGRSFRQSSVSYLHPLFLQKVEAWFDQVCLILAKYTLASGGPIAFVQLDNEMAGIHEWFGTLDYHPVSMGFGKEDGRYPRFLQQRYGTLSNLNQSYASQAVSFNTVSPDVRTDTDPAVRTRKRKDYYDFYTSSLAEYATILAGLVRKHGITTPFVHNSGNPGMNAHFLETIQALGDQYLLGSDHYYNLNQEWPQNNPTPQYAVRSLISLEMLRAMGFPPTVFEIPGGSASDWPPVTPGDALAAYLVNLAYGMKGSNYYIFTGGPNPPGAGSTTDLYDYGAGIGAKGDIRPLYTVQKEFGAFIQERPWLVSAQRLCDVRFALDFEQPRSAYYWTETIPGLVSQPEAWNYLRRGPLLSALCAGLSPALVDIDSPDWSADTVTPLIVAASSSMSASRQTRLTEFIRAGGHVLLGPVLPQVDEALFPCPILQEFLGTGGPAAAISEQARPSIAGVRNVNGTAYTCPPPPVAEILGVDEWSGKPIAWQWKYDSGGSLIYLGLNWLHAMREHERMLLAVLDRLGLRQLVYCSNPNIWAPIWVHEDKALCYLINLFTAPMTTSVSFQTSPNSPLTGIPEVTIPPITILPRDVRLSRR